MNAPTPPTATSPTATPPTAEIEALIPRSDTVLNLICGVSSWAISMMLVPIMTQHFLNRRPPLAGWPLFAPALICVLALVAGQFQTPRLRAATRCVVFGFVLNCAFWWLLFHSSKAPSRGFSPAIPTQPAPRPLLIPNDQ